VLKTRLFNQNGFGSTPVVLGSRVYVCMNGPIAECHEVSRSGPDGIAVKRVWSTTLPMPARTEEETRGIGDYYWNRIYAPIMVSDGRLFVLSSIGELFVVDAETGKQVSLLRRFPETDYRGFHARTRGGWREFYLGPMRTARHAFLGCKSAVFAFDAADPGKEVESSLVYDWWSSCPFFQGERVYLRTLNEVICLDQRQDAGGPPLGTSPTRK
jgi:outer membrane protein assembly factor BamB